MWVNLQNADGLPLNLSIITNQWRRLYLSMERTRVQQPGTAEILLAAGEAVSAALHPDYGRGLIALDTQLLDPPGVDDYVVNTLHDFNFFSPRLVQMIGHERLGAVPAHHVAPLPDGGLLLSLSANPLIDRKTQAAAYQAAAAVLGFPAVQQGC